MSQTPESCASLYIGNLAPSISEELLSEVFGTFGQIKTCKLIKDKQTGLSAGYGFVDFFEHTAAESALQVMNGRDLMGSNIKVNWAFQSSSHDSYGLVSGNAIQVFVGDLASDIDDKKLYQAFQKYPSACGARVMWDHNTGRSRGYGFVAFRRKEDAERAMLEMNGQYIGNRAVRCNWANQKHGEDEPRDPSSQVRQGDWQSVSRQVAPSNATVYVGNLPPEVTEQTLRDHFQLYGRIEELRLQRGQGYAFVTYKTHEMAARAIAGANGVNIGGRFCKASWGREKSQQRGPPQPSPPPQPPQMPQMFPYGGMYGQFGWDPSMTPQGDPSQQMQMPPMPPMQMPPPIDPNTQMPAFDPNSPEFLAYYYYQYMAPYYYNQQMMGQDGSMVPPQGQPPQPQSSQQPQQPQQGGPQMMPQQGPPQSQQQAPTMGQMPPPMMGGPMGGPQQGIPLMGYPPTQQPPNMMAMIPPQQQSQLPPQQGGPQQPPQQQPMGH